MSERIERMFWMMVATVVILAGMGWGRNRELRMKHWQDEWYAAHPVVKEVPRTPMINGAQSWIIRPGEECVVITWDNYDFQGTCKTAVTLPTAPPPKPKKESHAQLGKSVIGFAKPHIIYCGDRPCSAFAQPIPENLWKPKPWDCGDGHLAMAPCPAPLSWPPSGCIGCDLPPLTAKELSERTSVPLCDDSHIVGEHCLQDEAHRPKDYVCVEAPYGMITCGKIYHGPVPEP